MAGLLPPWEQVYKDIVDDTHETAEKQSNSEDGKRERGQYFKGLKAPRNPNFERTREVEYSPSNVARCIEHQEFLSESVSK